MNCFCGAFDCQCYVLCGKSRGQEDLLSGSYSGSSFVGKRRYGKQHGGDTNELVSPFVFGNGDFFGAGGEGKR